MECADTGLEEEGEFPPETACLGVNAPVLNRGGEVCGVIVFGSVPGCREGCNDERWPSERGWRNGGLSCVDAGVNGGEFIDFRDESGVDMFSRDGA